MKKNYKKNEPLVSVLIPTFNRPQYFYQALASVLRQSYENIQVIVVNDGGTDVSDIIVEFSDSRVVYINRKQNRGKAFSLNEALRRAEGKYIAYLDDDDLYYPNHIETLVNALENDTDCMVAYSDLYKVYCNISQNGNRQVLSKTVEVSRDFDRFFMLHFNHVLHVSMMHHRDLIEKAGLYNEQLSVLIDWDMIRRFVFFTDFYHVYQITGEYYHPMGDCDRISVQQRKNKQNYLKNVLTIRTARPPKPWPKIKDMSIIFLAERMDKEAGKTIGSIWRNTFYPYKLYLPMPQSDISKINTDMPNLVYVPINPESSQHEKVDVALEHCEGEYITIIPGGFPIKERSIENSLYALINCKDKKQSFLLEDATDNLWAAVFRKEDLSLARRNFRNLPLDESLSATKVKLRKPEFHEFPFQVDNMLQQAFTLQNNSDWLQAANIYEYIAQNHQNELWMKKLAANAFYEAGDRNTAAQLCQQINQQRPTVDTLLIEAKVRRQEKEYNCAIDLLIRAEQVIEGQECLWM